VDETFPSYPMASFDICGFELSYSAVTFISYILNLGPTVSSMIIHTAVLTCGVLS
jgi:hypothetical protein